MTLRIGVDLDGTLADLSSMYHDVETQLFGEPSPAESNENDESHIDGSLDRSLDRPDHDRLIGERARKDRQETVWRALKNIPDMWTRLQPIEPEAVRQLYAASVRHSWEVFFVTQRPQTVGATVQRQSQRWLSEQGFEMPSVLTLSGSRGKAAHALDLDFLIDDLPKNCIDVISDSKCRPLLVLRKPDEQTEVSAKRLNIGVVRSVNEAIALLAEPVPVSRESGIAGILKRLGLSRWSHT